MFFFLQFLRYNPILIAAAVVPAAVLLWQIYRADKMDKEPVGLLATLVAYGIAATALAKVTERLGVTALDYTLGGGMLYDLLLYFVVVGLSEEGFKYLLLKKRTWNSREFDHQFDGVVYAVFVSLGFALWENIGYVLSYGLSTALVRAVTAVPGHACFGVFMGAWYGMAKKYEARGDAERSAYLRKLALIVPVLLHGAYDFIAASGQVRVTWAFVAFVAAMFLAAFRLVRKLSREDEHMR